MPRLLFNGRLCLRFVLACCLVSCLLSVHAADITLKTVPGKMRYEPEFFRVEPGETVRLTFINDDEMQHNLIFTKPGTKVLTYAQRAWALGSEAQARQFVPEDRGTLFHSKVLNPLETEVLTFTVPDEPGAYPFVCTLPGHAFSMKGVMYVGIPIPDPTAEASSAPVRPRDRRTEDHRFHLEPIVEPAIIRASVENGPARGISVGFPGGYNLVFNAETCAVDFGWAGPFLDVGPVVGRNPNDRGANPARTLGQRFSLGGTHCPIRVGRADTSHALFRGYRRGQTPTFLYEVDGVSIAQTIRPAPKGTGFTYEFELSPTEKQVFFVVNPEALKLASDGGTWFDGLLVVSPENARRFNVTLTRE